MDFLHVKNSKLTFYILHNFVAICIFVCFLLICIYFLFDYILSI